MTFVYMYKNNGSWVRTLKVPLASKQHICRNASEKGVRLAVHIIVTGAMTLMRIPDRGA